MKRSYRLALISLVSVAGLLSACGDAPSTSLSASRPPVIHTGSNGDAPQREASPTAGADKMSFMAQLHFTLRGSFPELPSSAAGYRLTPGSIDAAKGIAAYFGITADPVASSYDPKTFDFGDVNDPAYYQGKSFSATLSGDGTWWFSDSSAYPDYSCATVGGDPMTEVDSVTVSGGGVVEVTEGVDGTVVTAVVEEPVIAVDDTMVPPDVTIEPVVISPAPGCEAPQEVTPQVTVSEAEIRSQLEALITAAGLDPSEAQFKYDIYSAEGSSYGSATLKVDGLLTTEMFSVGFAPDGTLSYASGFNMSVEKISPDYPLVSPQQAVDNLNESFNVMPMYRGEPDVAIDAALPVDCSPEDMAVDKCMPMQVGEPTEVEITGVTMSLATQWDVDGTVWLLPAYDLTGADDTHWTAIAVSDEFIAEDEVVTSDTTPVATPGDTIAPVTPDSPPPAPDTTDSVTGTVTVDTFKNLVGSGVDAASATLDESGFSLRPVRVDGEDMIVTMDYRENRVNVAVENGIVVEVVSIG